MKFTDAIASWTAYRAKLADLGSIAHSTFIQQTRIAQIIASSLGEHDLTALRKSHFDLWIAERRKTCAPVTIQGELNVVRQILNWCVDERLLARTDKPRIPTISVPNTEKPLPSDRDFVWYLTLLPQRTSEALEFMLLTGLAPHELERLQVQDYYPEQQELHIGDRKDFQVKTEARRRPVPLNERARQIWRMHSMGRLFRQNVFPKTGALQKAMRRLYLSTEDPPPAADGLTPKMMRKWFASKVAAEQSEAVLQRLLGHAPGSPITRKHYVRTTTEQARNAVDAVKAL